MNEIKKYIKKTHNEEGATLVELLAAVAILSIVVMSFLGFFVQAGSTNNRTDKVNEATLLAQSEMEHIVYYNQGQSLEDYPKDDRKHDDFDIITVINEKKINESGKKMYKIIITVKEKGGSANAQMETWLPIEEKSGNPDAPND